MDTPKCGANTKAGTCKRKAGWGTDHLGQGRCKSHGGATPIKHGRYSKITRPRIKELLNHYRGEGDPLDLTEEVHLLRALLTDYVERYDEMTEGIHRWHASFQDDYQKDYGTWREKVIRLTESDWADYEPGDLPAPPDPLDYVKKPRQLLDITAAATLIDRVGRMVERIEKIRGEGTITLATLDRVLTEIGAETVKALRKVVIDDATRTAILNDLERRWSTIHVDTADGARPPTGTRELN